MQKTNRRLVLTYVPLDGDVKILWEDYKPNYVVRNMGPDMFFKSLGYECKRMLLGIAEQCVRNKKKFNLQHCHWNLILWTEEVDNEFAFGASDVHT